MISKKRELQLRKFHTKVSWWSHVCMALGRIGFNSFIRRGDLKTVPSWEIPWLLGLGQAGWKGNKIPPARAEMPSTRPVCSEPYPAGLELNPLGNWENWNFSLTSPSEKGRKLEHEQDGLTCGVYWEQPLDHAIPLHHPEEFKMCLSKLFQRKQLNMRAKFLVVFDSIPWPSTVYPSLPKRLTLRASPSNRNQNV